MNLENKSTEDLLKIARGDSLQSRSTEDLLKVAQGKPVEAGVGMMTNIARGLFGRDNIMTDEGAQFADDLKTGATNLPSSALRAGGEVVDAIASPFETAKSVANIATMPFSEEGRAGLLNAGKETVNIRKRLREDPAGLLLDFAGVGPLKRLAGANKLAEVSQVADKINPIKALARLGGKTPAAVGNLGTGLVGFTTSKGRRVFDEAFEAGKEGGQRLDAFKAAQRGEIVGENVADEVLQGAKEISTRRKDAFGSKVDELTAKYADTSMDLDGVKGDVPDILLKYNIDVKAKNPYENFGSAVASEQTMVNRAVKMVAERNTSDPKSMIALYQQLDSINGKARLVGNTRASAVVGDLRDRVRKELSKLPGYDDAAAAYRADTKMLEQMQKSLSVGNMTSETMVTKLTNLLNDRDNLDMRRRLVGELEDVTGKPLKAQVAGIRTSEAFPTGIRATMTSGIGGVMAGVGGALVSPWMSAPFLLALPFTSPKLMGNMVSALGQSVSVGKIKAIEEAIAQVHKALPPGMATDSMTLGMVLSQLEQRAINPTQSDVSPQQPTMTQLLSRAQQNRSRANQPAQ